VTQRIHQVTAQQAEDSEVQPSRAFSAAPCNPVRGFDLAAAHTEVQVTVLAAAHTHDKEQDQCAEGRAPNSSVTAGRQNLARRQPYATRSGSALRVQTDDSSIMGRQTGQFGQIR